ncbi:mercuric transporter MerT family protein [Methylobacterium iners]|uniref:mercuric transporter MerT family protein n=1 Tax=Methylobacterium iners TaxID=418707 RepID=UPI0036175BEF
MATTDATTAARVRVRRTGASAFFAAGGFLAAIGASACCVLPLAFFALGVSGTWIGNLTGLAPYQPIFVGVAVACLAFGFLRVYRRPAACAGDQACARPLPSRVVEGSLWLAAILVVVALAFPYAAPLILGV